MMLLFGCEPDLAVKDLVVDWEVDHTVPPQMDELPKRASVTITNIGNARAGRFLVYVNADENPVSQNHRPQIIKEVSSLDPGNSVYFNVVDLDFRPLRHPDNHYLRNVYQIRVIADPKGMVAESSEDNNVAVAPVQVSAPDTVIDQSNLVPEGNLVVVDAQSIGQTVTASRTAALMGIEVSAVRCTATDADVIEMEVGQGTAAFGSISITGAALAGPGQCGVVPPALQPDVTGPGYFDLTPLTSSLTAGESYYFKLTSTSANDFRVGISSDLYGGGTGMVNGSPTSNDLVFKVLVAP